MSEDTTETDLMLSIDHAIQVMNRMNLITADIFDYFYILVLQWYQEEINSNPEEIPNLYPVLSGDSGYSQMFIRTFVQGFARQYCEHHNIEPRPTSFEFSQQDEENYTNLFMRNYASMQETMRHDIELVLDSMNLSYVWDTTVDGGQEVVHKNSAIMRVW